MYVQVLLVTIALGLLAWWASKRSSTPAPLPPGPAGDPIIGHVRIVPTSRPELSYAKWAKEYNSDLIYVNFMGQPAVILNTAQVAIDLLDKRSNLYSDRPDFHFFEESGWEEAVTFLSLGPKFRKHRKMMQNAFSPTNCIPYRSKQEDLSRILVSSLLDNPAEWERLISRFASSIILGIVYGIRITSDDNPFLKMANKISWYFSNGGPPGATLVDILPIVRRLPSWVTFIPSLKFARDSRPLIQNFRDLPFEAVKKSMANGTPAISFTYKMLDEKQGTGVESELVSSDITEDEIKGAASTIYAAGAETTFASLVIFVLNMVRNPAVQEKARRELDTVIGRDRLPTLDDRPNLPYVDRIFYETARWHPVVPLGVPHKSSKEDIYKNMYIPKGSLVMANAYAITHDSSVYAEPDKFNPDRYVPVAEGGAGEPLPVGHFGFGRRVCPGQHLGAASVWIASATILATLRISKAKDSDGKDITPDPKMSTGLESHPEHFPCVFEARDEQAVRLIRAATST